MATVSSDIHALDDPFYRSSDGKPMADNTEQFRWIVAVQGGLDSTFRDRPDVLVVGDLLWYPVEGDNKIRTAPDAMVVFGRPKGPRGSYIQYREEGVTPQVVFEVLSPGNRRGEMNRKREFYERYGVEEYYVLDPDWGRHLGYLRDDSGRLMPVAELYGWVSPRLGVRFELGEELRILKPDGRLFEFYLEVDADRDRAVEQLAEANLRVDQAERRVDQAEREVAAERRAREEERRARETEHERAERYHALLRAAGIDPEEGMSQA